jgi:hypothetical protein
VECPCVRGAWAPQVHAHGQLGRTSGLEFETAVFLGGGGLMHERLLQGFAMLGHIETLDLVLLVHPQR